MTLRDSLAQVQELLGRATPGTWECGAGKAFEPQTTVYCDDAAGSAVATCAHSMTVLIPVEQERANAAAIAAAVNWLREHGPELMKMLDRHGAGDAEDLEKFRGAVQYMHSYGSDAHTVEAEKLLKILDERKAAKAGERG